MTELLPICTENGRMRLLSQGNIKLTHTMQESQGEIIYYEELLLRRWRFPWALSFKVYYTIN